MHDWSIRRGTDGTEHPRPHLTQNELAERWQISARTLEKWRQQRGGPRYLRVGGRVRYPVKEIEAFEADQLRGAR